MHRAKGTDIVSMSLLNYFRRLEKPANEQAVVDSADRPSEVSQQPSPEGGQSKKPKGPDDDCHDHDTRPMSSSSSQSAVPMASSIRPTTSTSQLFAAKHAKGFNPKWQNGRVWLKYTEGLGMFCEFCQEFNCRPYDRDTWNLVPCKRLRLESVTDHEKCGAHKDAVKRKAGAKKQDDIAVAIYPTVNKNDMTRTFACLYFLCKQKIADTMS